MKTQFIFQIFFSVLVLALGAFAFYEYKKSQSENKQKEESALFLNDVKLEDLKAFRIFKEKEQLSAVQENNNWTLEKPVQDLASFTEISRWFGEITNQKVQKIQTEGSPQWEDYYLDKASRVEMDLLSGKNISFVVSRKSSFDGKYFVRKGEELFIGEQYFNSEVNVKDFDSFRNKKILPSFGHAKSIQFHGRENFKLHWANYKWKLDGAKKEALPLDDSRLDGFWTDSNNLKAIEIKEPVKASSLKKYKLNRPQLKITFAYPGKDEQYTLKLSPFQEDKAFLSVSHRNFIMQISKESAEKLILSKNEVWNHNFPFDYKENLAVQIERKDKKQSFKIKKLNDTWKSLNQKNSAIDSEKLNQLLNQIKELRGEKYRTGSVGKNARTIEIKNTAGETIFKLEEASINGNNSWIKTNLWKELISIPKNSIDEIFNQDIFSKKAEEKTKG